MFITEQSIFRPICKSGWTNLDAQKYPQIQRGQGGVWTPPPWKITAIGLLNNTGPDFLKNHKVTKPALNDR